MNRFLVNCRRSYLKTHARMIVCWGTLAGTIRDWTSSQRMHVKKARKRLSLSSGAELKWSFKIPLLLIQNQNHLFKQRHYCRLPTWTKAYRVWGHPNEAQLVWQFQVRCNYCKASIRERSNQVLLGPYMTRTQHLLRQFLSGYPSAHLHSNQFSIMIKKVKTYFLSEKWNLDNEHL